MFKLLVILFAIKVFARINILNNITEAMFPPCMHSYFSISVGGKNYFTGDHKDWGVAGIHDYKEEQNKLGVGEFSAVLNGIEFRSNVNTYSLRMPSVDGTFEGTKGE